jgi:hypothetical protein
MHHRCTIFRIAAPGLFLLLLLLASGCGGGKSPAATDGSAGSTTGSTPPAASASHVPLTSKRQYEHAMQVLGSSLETSLRLAGEVELAEAGKKSANSADASALESARRALRSAAVGLKRIVPPGQIRDAHALLIKGVLEYATELGRVISQLHAGGAPVVVLQTILRLKGVLDMQRASIQLAKRGYSIVAG